MRRQGGVTDREGRRQREWVRKGGEEEGGKRTSRQLRGGCTR